MTSKEALIDSGSVFGQRDNNWDHLSGRPKGRAPKNPYRMSGPEARKAGERRELTGNLGTLCEREAIKIWQMEKTFWEEDEETASVLAEAIRGVQSELALGLGDKPWKASEAAVFYQELAGSTGMPWEPGEKEEPQNKSLGTIHNIVDAYCGTDLIGLYERLASIGSSSWITPRIRYLVDTALILGKELLEPSFSSPTEDGFSIWPDVVCKDNIQFDAFWVKGFGWIEKQRALWSNSQDNGVEFLKVEPFLASEQPWALMEIKTPFRTAQTTGKRALSGGPIKRHFKKTLGRLGKVALCWSFLGNHFRFPEFIEFVYLRGYLPNAIHRVDLTAEFLTSWAEGLGGEIEAKYDQFLVYLAETWREEVGGEEELSEADCLRRGFRKRWIEESGYEMACLKEILLEAAGERQGG
jgi:hypothetical protein